MLLLCYKYVKFQRLYIKWLQKLANNVIIIYSDNNAKYKNILEGDKIMVRKQKWEKEFEEYDKQAETRKINELSSKFENKNITKEEYQELNNAIAKYKNIEKVSNIIEYKKQLEANREKINKEIEKIRKHQENEKNNKKIIESNEKLEEEIEKIQEELSDISKKIKAKDLSEEERKNLEDKKAELISKKEKNNKKYAQNQEKMIKDLDYKEIKDIKELEEEKDAIGINIGKCCFVGRMLMAGKSWEYIEVKYEENKKYTDKDNSLSSKVANQRVNKKEEKVSENESIDKMIEETGKEIGKEVEKINNDEIEINSEKQEDKVELVEQTEFQRKHPRLSKILSSVKNFFNRNKKSHDTEIETFKKVAEEVLGNKEEKTEIVENKEEKTESKEKNQRDEFLDYLKVVSENGIGQIKRDNAKQRFAENKKIAYTRETEKFGKDYADMSYKEEEEQEHK